MRKLGGTPGYWQRLTDEVSFFKYFMFYEFLVFTKKL